MESFTISRRIKVSGIKAAAWKEKLRPEIAVELPTCWADLTPEWLELVASVLFGNKTEADAMAELFVKLANLKPWELALIPDDDVYSLMVPCFDFIKEPICIKTPIIKWIPEKYYGPKEDLSGLCWKQFSMAEHYCSLYRSTKEVEHLESLACALYCCQSEYSSKDTWRKGMSEPYQAAMLAEVKTIPLALKQAIYLNYVGLKANLIKEEVFDSLFPVKEKERSDGGSSEQEDWHAVSISLAGEKFGTIEDLYYTAVHDVMKYLDMKISTTE